MLFYEFGILLLSTECPQNTNRIMGNNDNLIQTRQHPVRRLANLETRERVGWSSRLASLHDFTFYASRDKKSDRKRLNYAANCTPAREPSLILSPSADRELTDDTSPNLE